MKILATIESVEITRKVQHSDGTWGNVYGITLASGDDRILADRFTSEEWLKKAGIVVGAVGNAQLEFRVNRGTGKNGNPYCIQNIRLVRFYLANRNLTNDNATPATEAAPAAPAEPAQEAAQEAQADGGNMPF